MRPGAIFPIIFAAGAVVLTFLCLFAGHQKGWMEDYHIMTLNTSRIGQNVINTTVTSDSDILPDFVNNFINNVTSSISDGINEAIDSFAERLGVEDFYSYHVLDYCYGSYVPQPVPNATVHSNDIHKNVSGCSNRTAMYSFDPAAALQYSLDSHDVPITLDDLDWPDQITDALDAVRIASKAAFVLYCIGIGLAFVSFVTSLLGLFSSSRITAFINILIASLGFLALGIASAIITAIMIKGSKAINKYGDDIGIEAHRGNKYLALTWAATGALFLSTLVWCFECCLNHRRRTPPAFPEKRI